MFDTVKVKLAGPGWKSMGSEWKITETEMRKPDGRRVLSRFAHNESTGMRVMGEPEAAGAVEVSLPRLLFGDNGRLISSRAELLQGVEALQDAVSQVCHADLRDVLRADLVWQFNGNPSAWVCALGTHRHPEIRSNPCQWFNDSVRWTGSGLVLRVYDKRREQTGEPGNVVRMEAQARGKTMKALREAAGPSLRSMDWATLWQWYRERFTAFPAFKDWDRSRPLSLGAFLHLLNSSGCKIGGQRAVDVYLNARHVRQQYRLRAQMARSAVEELLNCDLGQIFPENGPPEAVHCMEAAA